MDMQQAFEKILNIYLKGDILWINILKIGILTIIERIIKIIYTINLVEYFVIKNDKKYKWICS